METSMKMIYRLAAFAVVFATPLPVLAATINAVMYKNPQCSCCEAYAAYLEQNGFKVEVKPVNNLAQISSDAGVPANRQSDAVCDGRRQVSRAKPSRPCCS